MNGCYVPGCARFASDTESLCGVHRRRAARLGVPSLPAWVKLPRRRVFEPERHYVARRMPDFPDAACRGSSWDWVDPPHRKPAIVGSMLLTCTGCVHMLECREWAVANNERGVWGATLDADRAEMRRRAR